METVIQANWKHGTTSLKQKSIFTLKSLKLFLEKRFKFRFQISHGPVFPSTKHGHKVSTSFIKDTERNAIKYSKLRFLLLLFQGRQISCIEIYSRGEKLLSTCSDDWEVFVSAEFCWRSSLSWLADSHYATQQPVKVAKINQGYLFYATYTAEISCLPAGSLNTWKFWNHRNVLAYRSIVGTSSSFEGIKQKNILSETKETLSKTKEYIIENKRIHYRKQKNTLSKTKEYIIENKRIRYRKQKNTLSKTKEYIIENKRIHYRKQKNTLSKTKEYIIENKRIHYRKQKKHYSNKRIYYWEEEKNAQLKTICTKFSFKQWNFQDTREHYLQSLSVNFKRYIQT